jgi:cytochrome c peroxidase
VSREALLTAVATYERKVVAGWAPFDRWVEGNEEAISPEAERGFALFAGAIRRARPDGAAQTVAPRNRSFRRYVTPAL